MPECIGTISPNGDGIEHIIRNDEHLHQITPLLVQPNGNVYRLGTTFSLRYHQLQNHSLCIVGPHGQIVPFFVEGIRQQVVTASGNIFHLDTHADRESSDFLGEAANTANCILKYLSTEELADFFTLIEATRKDIQTFIEALGQSGCFTEIAAVIRGKLYMNTLYGPCSKDAYIQDSNPNAYKLNRSHYTLSDLDKLLTDIESFLSTVQFMSVDADFVGTTLDLLATKETLSNLKAENTPTALGILNKRLDVGGNNVLHGLSVDDKWCLHPAEFTMTVLKDFYTRVIQKHV